MRKNVNIVIVLIILVWGVSTAKGIYRIFFATENKSGLFKTSSVRYGSGVMGGNASASPGGVGQLPMKSLSAGSITHSSHGSAIGGIRLGSTSSAGRGRNMASGRGMTASGVGRRSARSLGNSYGASRGFSMMPSIGFGRTSFGSTSGLYASSSATVQSIGGGTAGGTVSSYRGSRYSASPVSSIGAVGSVSLPTLAFNGSVNSFSNRQTTVNGSVMSAAPRRYNTTSFGHSGSRLSGFNNGLRLTQWQGQTADNVQLAQFGSNYSTRHCVVGDLDNAWRDAFYAENGYYPSDTELEAYKNYYFGQGIFSAPTITDSSISTMDDLYTSWYNQFVAEIGRPPYNDEELYRFINWKMGSTLFFNPDDPTPPDSGSGLDDMYTMWFNQFVTEIGREPDVITKDADGKTELDRFIEWKLGLSLFFNPNEKPDDESVLDPLYKLWYDQFVAEFSRPPVDDGELEAYIEWCLGGRTGNFFYNKAPIGDGVWILLLLALAMIISRKSKVEGRKPN